MKKITYLLSTICIASVFLFSCEIDNYDLPDGTLSGRVIDAVTGNPIITEQPNGFRIQLREISWSDNPTAQFFWGKADGTFNNTKLFAGKYEVIPVEGAFVTSQAQTVDIRSGGSTTADFTVTPYISFSNVSLVKEGSTSVRATFTLTRNVPSAALQDYRVFATDKTQYVGTVLVDNDVSSAVTGLNESLLGTPISVLLNNYIPGKTYWIRIGARCVNASGRYNMTEVVKIDM
jgi:hypothetical protein